MSLKITIISDINSWINQYLPNLFNLLVAQGHQVKGLHQVAEITPGDIVFYLSCGQIASEAVLSRNRHNLVVHESALPQGRGWSPLTWQILEGKNKIPIVLFEAEANVDSGKIYLQDHLVFDGTELVDELRAAQAQKTIELCQQFVAKYPSVVQQGQDQVGTPTFYPRRRPQDSQMNVDKTIREQFNLLRVVDNDSYPATFEIAGQTYILKISKFSQSE